MIIVDEMLHDVAKWLRIFGIPVKYVRGLKDEEILAMLKEGDVLVTSDVQLSQRWKNSVLVPRFDDEARKVAFVLKRLGKKPKLTKTLCPICGTPLVKVKRSQLNDLGVTPPPKVYQMFDEFYYCPKCKKLYWEGSHWKHIEEFARRVTKILENEDF
jgi:uncharacterized protein with PIN domain